MPSLPDAPPAIARPRATVLGAFLEGWRRVIRAPAITIGVVVMTAIAAAPLAIVMQRAMESNLGASVTSERVAAGWDAAWADEFASHAQGVGQTFTVEILGFGGTLGAISRLVDAAPLNPAIACAAAVYIAMWVFLSGGIIDRFARARPVRASAFFAACGVYSLRFLRLAIGIGAAYWALFRWLHPFLFHTLYDRWTRDVTAEHTVVLVRAGLYAVFLSALAAVSLIADFAKVRAVVEDRRSMIGAIGASGRFIRRRARRLCGLYALNVIAALVLARLWLQIAPTARTAGWAALLAAQVYILARIWAKLAFMASEIVFFQGELAHATYTAAPEPVWPDSPAVEAIERLRNR